MIASINFLGPCRYATRIPLARTRGAKNVQETARGAHRVDDDADRSNWIEISDGGTDDNISRSLI